MRLKFCWLMFDLLVAIVIVAISPIHTLLRLGGDFRSFVLPLGIVGAVLLV